MLVAIGDIHGYHAKFCRLMEKLAERVDFATDTLIFLGDYVDGGGCVAPLIHHLRRYQDRYPHWVFLKGNHEQMLLDAIANPTDRLIGEHWFTQGGAETLMSYEEGLSRYERAIGGGYAKLKADCPWFEERPLVHETERFIFVHAGVVPGKQPGDCHADDLLWIRERFIDSTYDWGKRVIFGHTFTTDPIVKQNKIGIDTLHRGGGQLTAVILNEDDPDAMEFIAA